MSKESIKLKKENRRLRKNNKKYKEILSQLDEEIKWKISVLREEIRDCNSTLDDHYCYCRIMLSYMLRISDIMEVYHEQNNN